MDSKKDALCSICDLNPSKYKCSSCLSPYCSVKCYKVHTASACEKTTKVPEKSAKALSSKLEEILNPKDKDDAAKLLKAADLEKLENIEGLQLELDKKNIKQAINEILQSDSPLESLKVARNKVEGFENLVSMLLPVIGEKKPKK